MKKIFNSETGRFDWVNDAESDPIFSAWLIATPPIYTETDPLSWSKASDQTLLTGDKSGSFNLTTTGIGTLGSGIVNYTGAADTGNGLKVNMANRGYAITAGLASGPEMSMYVDTIAGYLGTNTNHPLEFYVNNSTALLKLFATTLDFHADNFKARFGAAEDASIYYNGTDLIIDPKEVGTGVVNLNGGNLTTTGIGTFLNIVETTPTLLKLDQTTPQSVINGQPNFMSGAKIDPTGTFDFSTIAGVSTSFGIYNPIPDDTGQYSIVTYFTDADTSNSVRVGGLAFGGEINGGASYYGPAEVYGLNGYINIKNGSYTAYAYSSYLQVQVIGGSVCNAVVGETIDIATSQADSYIETAKGIRLVVGAYDTGQIDEAVGISIDIQKTADATITTAMGLKIENITATTAYAIQTGLGLVRFGDTAEVRAGLTTVGAILKLSTQEPTVVANDVLGRINFSAPLEASGTDAVLVGASIVAVAEAEFTSSVNKTSLLFQTGASETATTKMTILSNGNVGIGTTAPGEKLEVTGNIQLSGSINSVGGFKANGTAGISATITTAALTGGGAQGSMTFTNGILTAQTQAT